MLELQNNLQRLEQLLVTDKGNEKHQEETLIIKNKIEIISMEKARGAQIRARTKWVQEGEKNTTFFLGLEKYRAKSNVMTHIKKDNGITVSKQMDVLNEQARFYSTLYSKTDTDKNIKDMVSSFVQGEEFPKLNSNEAAMCEGLMNEQETSSALSRMKNGTSPGNDGLTVEFLKFFWGRIKTMVTSSFNEAFDKGEISYSQKQGIIILIHKGKELSRDDLSNWRPITLTNTDYKMLAKVLATRLSLVIDKLINQDQVGYLKGRNITSVIRTIDDVINYLNITKKGGYLLAVDYKKSVQFNLQNIYVRSSKQLWIRRSVKKMGTDSCNQLS
eukprot:TRINITY_DN26057_c0_g1_i12.p2 TRINITY_DN26057_c0_g1~~TRINITY_DN26057_c0_g1_i12.p2  ORF type:complete len:330 (+),score=21.92 TRINITY_DN26057_c0_g1_i12:2115-3104(+)